LIETIEFETLEIPKWFNLILCEHLSTHAEIG
jgi:hypothetical protein